MGDPAGEFTGPAPSAVPGERAAPPRADGDTALLALAPRPGWSGGAVELPAAWTVPTSEAAGLLSAMSQDQARLLQTAGYAETAAGLRTVTAALGERGVTIVGLAGLFNLIPPDFMVRSETPARAIEELQTILRAALPAKLAELGLS